MAPTGALHTVRTDSSSFLWRNFALLCSRTSGAGRHRNQSVGGAGPGGQLGGEGEGEVGHMVCWTDPPVVRDVGVDLWQLDTGTDQADLED